MITQDQRLKIIAMRKKGIPTNDIAAAVHISTINVRRFIMNTPELSGLKTIKNAEWTVDDEARFSGGRDEVRPVKKPVEQKPQRTRHELDLGPGVPAFAETLAMCSECAYAEVCGNRCWYCDQYKNAKKKRKIYEAALDKYVKEHYSVEAMFPNAPEVLAKKQQNEKESV